MEPPKCGNMFFLFFILGTKDNTSYCCVQTLKKTKLFFLLKLKGLSSLEKNNTKLCLVKIKINALSGTNKYTTQYKRADHNVKKRT